MRRLVRIGWILLMVALYIFIWKGFLFKDDVRNGRLLEFHARASSSITFSKPFKLEAGNCQYFILTTPQGKALPSEQIDKPIGVECSGKRYFVASQENASTGKWAMEMGSADIRATSLDESPIVATIPNEDNSDILFGFVLIPMLQLLCTLLFFLSTENVDLDLPSWMKVRRASSSSSRSQH